MLLQFIQSPALVHAKHIRQFIRTYAKEDNWHNIDPDTGNLGYGWIHYAIIRTFRPKHILVVGSKYGFIPAICALGCKDNRYGTVDFVDAGYDQGNVLQNKILGAKKNMHWGGVGFWNHTDPRKHFGIFNLQQHIVTHIETTKKFVSHSKNAYWGYIYLDGDHSYGGVTYDFDQFYPRLTRGGIMAFHDINTKKLGGLTYGVSRFWSELKRTHIHMLEIPGLCGLGLVQKI